MKYYHKFILVLVWTKLNTASRQAFLVFTMQHLWQIGSFRIHPVLISLRHADEVGSLRPGGGIFFFFLFTTHRLGETHYVTFSFLDTLCVIFEIPISRYSLLSVIPHFSKHAVWEKQGSLVTQLPGVNVLGNIWSICYFWPDCNETRIFWRFPKKHSNIKFHENPSSWSRVLQWGRRTDAQTDI